APAKGATVTKASPGTAPDQPKVAEKPKAAPEKSKAAAAAAGAIAVHQQVSDPSIQRFLARFLPKYPGVRSVTVGVDGGVVTLQGRVDDDDTQDELTDVVKRVEGVRLVLNQMNTDGELMTAWEFAGQELGTIRDYFGRKWVVILLALGIV